MRFWILLPGSTSEHCSPAPVCPSVMLNSRYLLRRLEQHQQSNQWKTQNLPADVVVNTCGELKWLPKIPGAQLCILDVAVKDCLGDGHMVHILAPFCSHLSAVFLFGSGSGVGKKMVAVTCILVQPIQQAVSPWRIPFDEQLFASGTASLVSNRCCLCSCTPAQSLCPASCFLGGQALWH